MPRKTEFKIKLGARIKTLREEKKLTQVELGKRLNVKKTTINNYESGYSEPNGETLVQLAIILNTCTDYLLGLTTYRNPQHDIEQQLSALNLSDTEYASLVALIKEGKVPSPSYLLSKDNDKLTQACKICSHLDYDYTPAFDPEQEKEIKKMQEENHKKVKDILLLLNKEKIVKD